MFPLQLLNQNRYRLFDYEPPRRYSCPFLPETLSPGFFFKREAPFVRLGRTPFSSNS